MKKLALAAAGVFFTLTTVAQTITGNGQQTNEKRETTDFSKIEITGNFNVTLFESNSQQLTVSGDENIVSEVITSVEDGILKVAVKKGRPFSTSKSQKISLKIPYRLLNRITMTGAGNVNVKNTLKNDVEVILDGSGQIKLKAKTANVASYVMGSGKLILMGQTDSLSCKVIGSGSIDAYCVESGLVDALVSGSGIIEVTPAKAITGRISGSGNISFAGMPEKRDLKRTGNGIFISL